MIKPYKAINFHKSLIKYYIELSILFYILSFSGFVKYIIFSIWILINFARNNYKIKCVCLYIMIPSIIFVFIGILMTFKGGFSFFAFKEIIFIMLPPLGAVIIQSSLKNTTRERYIDIMFIAITIISLGNIINFNFENYMESQYAFIFGIFTLYFLKEQKKILMIISLIFLILAHKRISNLATFICFLTVVFFDYLGKYFVRYKNRLYFVRATGFVVTISLILWIYFCKKNIIALLMKNWGINSQGRLEIWEHISSMYEVSALYLGHGIGNIEQILDRIGQRSFRLLHNDILTFYCELGFIGFIIYIYSHFSIINRYVISYRINFKNLAYLLVFFIYTFICFCTDNISIYINYLFPFYIILLQCVLQSS